MSNGTQRTLIYLVISLFFAFTIALGIGGLVSFIDVDWGWITAGAIFGWVLAELISRRPKFKWEKEP